MYIVIIIRAAVHRGGGDLSTGVLRRRQRRQGVSTAAPANGRRTVTEFDLSLWISTARCRLAALANAPFRVCGATQRIHAGTHRAIFRFSDHRRNKRVRFPDSGPPNNDRALCPQRSRIRCIERATLTFVSLELLSLPAPPVRLVSELRIINMAKEVTSHHPRTFPPPIQP
jgi:hypothetical protein